MLFRSTAIQRLYVMKKTGKSLSELTSVMKVYQQVLVNATVKNDNKHAYLEDLEIQQAISELEGIFKGEGRVLIRPSGTEPLVRVMIEGKDKAVMQEEAEKLAALIETRLN